MRARPRWGRLALVGGMVALGAWPVAARTDQPAPPPAPPRRVVVKYGDSLWTLAREYGDPRRDVRAVIAEIARANRINPGMLRPGQVLVVPSRVQGSVTAVERESVERGAQRPRPERRRPAGGRPHPDLAGMGTGSPNTVSAIRGSAAGRDRKEVVVKRSITVVVVLLLAASGAWAAPSLFGPTGLIVIPSAEVVGMAGVNAQWAQISFDDVDETIVSANVGPLPKLEVGAAHLDVDGGGSETIINAKYQVLRPPLIDTAISAGVIDITDEIDVSPYLVLSHTLGVGYFPAQSGLSNPRVHAGIGGGMLSGVFLGASVTVLDRLELMAEYDTEDLNIGARLPLTSWLVVTAAGLDGFDDFAIAAAAQTPF